MVTELSEPFDMALQSFVQHLKVLEDCGLINSRKVGQVRMGHIAPNKLDSAQEWISELRIAWENRLDRLDKYLKKTRNRVMSLPRISVSSCKSTDRIGSYSATT